MVGCTFTCTSDAWGVLSAVLRDGVLAFTCAFFVHLGSAVCASGGAHDLGSCHTRTTDALVWI